MRFVTFRHRGKTRAGILDGDAGPGAAVVDLAHPAMRLALGGIPPEMPALIGDGLEARAEAIRVHGLAKEALLPFEEVRLLAPIPRPRRIFAFAHNYRDAVAERGMAPPDAPVLFIKDASTVIGPEAAVLLPAEAGGCTYEVELAAVIGSRARAVGVGQALAHVVAYGVFNDISASEMIRRDNSFARGKNLPTFGPFGPYLATADEVGDPNDLRITLAVDGDILQESSTAQMLYGVAELVSFLSHRYVLEPGDVIATGTPAGVAPMRTPPTWLRPGTTLRAAIEGLGTLVNPVREGAAHG